jgi:hypothetical protein
MQKVQIRETTIRPTGNGETVHIRLSDAADGEPSAALVLTIVANLPRRERPLTAQSQHEAMEIAQACLSGYLRKLGPQITDSGFDIAPR